VLFLKKKLKIALISISGILLVFIIVLYTFLMSIRVEFTKYLDERYPNLLFNVGFTKINIIYGNFYVNVTCLDDGTFFPISKSFNTKIIKEDYPQYKSQIQYNSKIKDIFDVSDIGSYIKSVTGGGKIPYERGGVYTQINIHLIDEAEHTATVKKILYILKEKNISAEKIIFTYEKDKHVYEVLLSSDDYNLTESEIKAKVKKIK